MRYVAFLIAGIVAGVARGFSISQEMSRDLIKARWSVFGSPRHRVRPGDYTNGVEDVETETPMGVVRGIGKRSSRENVRYRAYFGIPFAKPPLGQLRFKAPVPAEPWGPNRIYDATFERASCLQYEKSDGVESEDCLYVNVYTPAAEGDAELLPVMFFIHGGAFIQGSSKAALYAPDFFVERGVVLVTFNYRLGALGFLSLQNEDVPGNAGLKDQSLALKWVRDNIESFGGDPRKVTIFGESAGSASVHYHLLSGLSKGLFRGAILQSGSATCPWAYRDSKNTKKLAVDLARRVGCARTSAEETAACLRQVDAREISEKQQGVLKLEDLFNMRPFAFVPTDEPALPGAFLTRSPHDAMVQNSFHPVPVVIGTNSREGLIALPALKQLDPLGLGLGILGLDLSIFFPHQLRELLSPLGKIYVNRMVRSFYVGGKQVGAFSREEFVDIITDTSFVLPIQQVAALLSNGSAPVYNYVFSYNGPYGFYKQKLFMEDERGVCHGDELGYMFYDRDLHPSYNRPNVTLSTEAEDMVDTIISMWTNFAKTGNPTPEDDDRFPVKWTPRKLEQLTYIEMGNSLQLKTELNKELRERVDFWFDLVDKIHQM